MNLVFRWVACLLLFLATVSCNRRLVIDETGSSRPEPVSEPVRAESTPAPGPSVPEEFDPPEHSAYFDGCRAVEQGEWQKAAQLFLETIRVEGDTVEVHDRLGQVHWKLRDLPRARTHLRQALDLLNTGRLRDPTTLPKLQASRIRRLLDAIDLDLELEREARRARSLGEGR